MVIKITLTILCLHLQRADQLMPYEFLNIIYFIFTANLLLQDTIERIQVGKKYGDIYRGIFLIRGENVVLVGEFVSSLLHYLIHVHFFYVDSIEYCFSY